MHQGAIESDEESTTKLRHKLHDLQKVLAEGCISKTEAEAHALRMVGNFKDEEDGKPYICLFP